MSKLLTNEDVAQLLTVPVATLRYWRHVGSGPRSIKIGRHVRYLPEDIDRWLDENARPAAS